MLPSSSRCLGLVSPVFFWCWEGCLACWCVEKNHPVLNPGEITKHELENSKDSSWHFDEHPFYIILNFGGGLVSEHEVCNWKHTRLFRIQNTVRPVKTLKKYMYIVYIYKGGQDEALIKWFVFISCITSNCYLWSMNWKTWCYSVCERKLAQENFHVQKTYVPTKDDVCKKTTLMKLLKSQLLN